jgi:thiamine pyrophosphokinase
MATRRPSRRSTRPGRAWRDGIELVVAADGGARAARDTGFAIDLIVGDGDSLGDTGLAEFTAAGVAVERSPSDKDESDTELAVLACLARGATSIAIVGAFGGRVDHTLANVWLLALPALEGRHAELLDGRTCITLLRAPGRDGLPATASPVVVPAIRHAPAVGRARGRVTRRASLRSR